MISTEACNEYLGLDKDSAQLDQLPDQLINEYTIKIHEIERLTQRLFGNISTELQGRLSCSCSRKFKSTKSKNVHTQRSSKRLMNASQDELQKEIEMNKNYEVSLSLSS